jgi:hypothetical protein
MYQLLSADFDILPVGARDATDEQQIQKSLWRLVFGVGEISGGRLKGQAAYELALSVLDDINAAGRPAEVTARLNILLRLTVESIWITSIHLDSDVIKELDRRNCSCDVSASLCTD